MIHILYTAKKKNGALKEMPRKKQTYGYAVHLLQHDEFTGRDRWRDIYVHNIIIDYILKLDNFNVVVYKDKEVFNLSKDNIEFKNIYDINPNWKQMDENENFFISDNGLIYDKVMRVFRKYHLNQTGYAYYSINS